MDYSNMSESERNHIDELFSKDISELTSDELEELTNFKAYVYAKENYRARLYELEKEKDNIRIAYRSTLSEEAQANFDAKIKSIMEA